MLDTGQLYEFTGRERLYEPGVRHFVDGMPLDLEWAEGDTYIAAIDDLLAAKLVRETPPPPTLEEAKAAAKEEVKVWAVEQIASMSTELNWGPVGTFLLLDETSRYLQAGSPANPTPGQYRIANKWKDRRSDTLAGQLAWQENKFLAMYDNAANIIDIWNAKIADIEAATTVEEVQAVIDSL